MVLDKRSARCTTFDGEAMASVLSLCIAVRSSNERDYEFLDSIKQL